MTHAYDPSSIEPHWQRQWTERGTFRAVNPGDPGFDPRAPKAYVLDMFPYPSGSGLHVGHALGYVGTDVFARRRRMQGANVLHPMGWDAFGLPAEQYAIQAGRHPVETTAANTANYRAQLQRIGMAYDWSREINTSDPAYYRWTQWIFARLFDQGLVYRAEMPVWWCEELKTVLSNEEVIHGRSERGDHPCVRRPLEQWMLRITAYAERLLADLEGLDWPESIKAQQREWIGRSEGASVRFAVEGLDAELEVFTTRPDTLWGATYMVVAPEHPLASALAMPEQRAAVQAYIAAAAQKTELERTDLAKQKTGVPTGRFARNPVIAPGDERGRIPIHVADYVLATYGTGAIMAVPGHDERDHEYALRYGLPVREVVRPVGAEAAAPGGCFTGEGVAVHSGPLDGLASEAAKARAIAELEARGAGAARVQYKMRDWLFSRQRYWGEPFPLVLCSDGRVERVPDSELPVELPAMDDFTPAADGSAPLARVPAWLHTSDPRTGAPALRSTDVMPGWAGSCWYWLRFMDPHNAEEPFAREAERYWGPVDLYVGGASHAVMHLLYARFWHKVLFDLGIVSTAEPFARLFNQGMLTAYAYRDPSGRVVPSDAVEPAGTGWRKRGTGEALEPFVTKMAKSLGNVVNPDEVVAEFGADTLRLYLLFMGPLAESKPWNPRDIAGCRRFVERVWRLFVDPEGDRRVRAELALAGAGEPAGEALELERALNQALARADDAFEHFNFNTAVAAFMAFVNEATKRPAALTRSQAERFVRALAPFAPHVAEELWARLGAPGLAAEAPWPQVDARFLESEDFELVVQVQGKLRGRVRVAQRASEDELAAAARGAVREWLDAKQIVKTIVVPGKLVNFVVRG